MTEPDAELLEDVAGGLLEENARLRAERDSASSERNEHVTLLAQMTGELGNVQGELNECVALLAQMARELGWPVGIGRDVADDCEEDWRTVLFVELPTGQVSWHYHDTERHLLDGLPAWESGFDAHSPEAKRQRVRGALAPEVSDE